MSINSSLNNLIEQQSKLLNLFNTNETRWNSLVETTITDIKSSYRNLESNGFYKTVYVNSSTGSDNNIGSLEFPFKSIKAAVDSIPIGAQAEIHLSAGLNFIIDTDITITNKVINFVSSNNNEATIKFNYMKVFNIKTSEYRWTTNRFIIGQLATLGFNSVNIETMQLAASDQNDPTVPNGIDYSMSVISPINSNGFIYFNDSYIELKSFDLLSINSASIMNLAFTNSIIKKNISSISNKAYLCRLLTGHLNLSFDYSSCQILEGKNLKTDLIKIVNPQNVKLGLNE